MQRFQNILFFVHPHRIQSNAIERVRWLAEYTKARITVFGIEPLSGTDIGDITGFLNPRTERSEIGEELPCQAALDTIVQHFQDHGINARALMGHGPEISEILQQMTVGNHDLCIKPIDLASLSGFWPSTDLQLVRQCPSAVWLLHPNQTGRVQHLLAAVDLAAENEPTAINDRILSIATALAALDHALLDVLHAWWMPEESALRHGFIRQPKAQVDTLVDQAQNQARWQLTQLMGGYARPDVDMHCVLEPGLPKEVIPSYARNRGVDTLVMGTAGRSGLASVVIGNTAETVLKQLQCSLLIVRALTHTHEMDCETVQ